MENTVLERLIEIESVLKSIQTELDKKKNLFCPGCRTLRDTLDSMERIMIGIEHAKEADKIDQILEISKEIQKITIESRVAELQTQLLDGIGPRPLISEVMQHE